MSASDWPRWVAASHRAGTGEPLPDDRPALAHDDSSDPRITWVNPTAALLWERPADRFVGIPSRWTALPGDRAERTRALATAEVTRGYRGVRVSATGRRFEIQDATIWPVADDAGRVVGQAATFSHWRPLPRVLIEALATTEAEVADALAAGADRIELCARADLGGITPAPGLVRWAVAAAGEAGAGVMVMARPRGGDFCYSPTEWAELARAVDDAAAAGAAGVVLGCLEPDGTVAIDQTVALVRRFGGPVTFHRAIDATPDPVAAARVVAETGCSRILSSGGAVTAPVGRATLARMNAELRGGPVTLVAGSGVSPANAAGLVAATGVTELHGSLRDGTGRSLVNQVRARLDRDSRTLPGW